MNNHFGLKIRALREHSKLYLRQVAPLLEMDIAQLSKIEKGRRQMKREQISLLADLYKIDKAELETLWLADQILEVVKNSSSALQAISAAESQIKIISKKHRLRTK